MDAPKNRGLIGEIVHYVLPNGGYPGEHRPALVVKVWGDEYDHSQLVQLQVFTDSGSDQRSNDQLPPVLWATSVKHDEEDKARGTWHYRES